jgi:hypothetical protein
MSIEAMKMALEALEEINKLSIGESAICLPAEIDAAMDALRQAIEQAEQKTAVSPGKGTGFNYARALGITVLQPALETKQKTQYQKSKSYLDDFECPRCGHCCKVNGQEPVAWMYVNKDGECEKIEYGPVFDDHGVTLLYTAPPQRKPLTDEKADELIRRFARYELLRAIEAAHGIGEKAS